MTGLRPTAAYSVSTATPARAAIAATLVAAYPCSANSSRAAESTARWVAAACSARTADA